VVIYSQVTVIVSAIAEYLVSSSRDFPSFRAKEGLLEAGCYKEFQTRIISALKVTMGESTHMLHQD
jgi:hypothetical protein